MLNRDELLPKIGKCAMREITNSSKSKLSNRLYRNSSLNRINPNISMLSSSVHQFEPSSLNNSSSANNSQLIASISLKKFNRKFQHQPHLQISNGKVLVNKNRSQIQESFMKGSPKSKKMFKKLQKLSYSPTNRILPDDLIDFPIEKDQISKVHIAKKSHFSPPKTKSNKLKSQGEKQDLIPQDFIQLLCEDKNITNEFCYLKKMDHPYDLKIVEFDKNFEKKEDGTPVQYPNEYITISSRGVTYFSQQQPRFVPLEQWLREANYFKKIVKLDFFKNFKVIKNFSNWKKYLRKSAMKSTMEKLKQKLVVNDKFLRVSLLEIRRICNIMETDVSYCRFDECQRVTNFRQFKAAQEVFIQNEFERRIIELQQNIKEVLIHNMAESMKEFKQQNKISSSIEGKGMPLLIGDEKNLQMPYTKQATLRTQQQKFQKFIKLVDLLITHSKVNMMSQSTQLLAKKIDEENQNYEKQVVQSNYKNTFKGKQYLQCTLALDPNQPALFLRPTIQDLTSLFEDIVNRSVVRLCRNHKKISSDIDVLCVIYDNQQQFPKQTQSQTLKAIMTSDNRQQQMLRLIMNAISISYNHIVTFITRFKDLAKVNYENVEKLNEIQDLLPKDHELIKSLIEKWHKEKQIISQISKEHEGPIFELNLKEFKEKAEKTTNACLLKIKQIIPNIFEEAIRELQTNLTEALSQMQQQPIGTQALIVFNQHKTRISNEIEDYSDRMMQISCLQILMRSIMSSNSQTNSFKKYEKEIRQLQSSLNILRRKLDQADMNNKRYETQSQKEVKQMAQRNAQNLKLLYKQIEMVNKQTRSVKEMTAFIQKNKQELTSITEKFNSIRVYQHFLNLEESDESSLNSFTKYFQMFEQIWSTVYEFEKYFSEIEAKPWGTIKTSEINLKLEEFISVFINLQKQINHHKEKDSLFQFSARDQAIIKQTLQKIEQIRPLIETIQCLNDKILGDKEWKEIKSTLESKNPKLIRILEQDRLEIKVSQLINVNAMAQLSLFKGISSKAKKNGQITQKMEIVKSFSNFSKQHLGLFRNLTERFRAQIGDFMQDLDEKIIMANFILEQAESNDKEKAKNDRNTLEKLRQILILWNQYEEHVEYFEPIYASTDWKNTQQAKLFISATEQNWKKTYKSYKDSNLSKILTAERIIPSLKESNEILESLYPSMSSFFNSKRIQSTRLYFLPDNEIVKIHSENKDFRGFNNYIGKLFPTVKQLLIKQEEQIPQEVMNLDGEILPLKLGRISNFQVEEMIRIIDQGVKSGIKSSLKNCHNSFDSEEFNRVAWIKEYPLQALIFITGVYFSRIIEQDYLSGDGDDLEKLYNYHLAQIDQLRKIIKQCKENESLFYKKLLVLLTQAIATRDTIHHLISSNVASKQSYEWLKQVRHYYNMEQATVEYLNVPVSYGNQFVCLSRNPLITATLNEKAIVQLVNNILCCNNIPIVQKSFLPELSAYNAKPYTQICVSSSQQIGILQNVFTGTWLTGSLTDLILPVNPSPQQLKLIATIMQQVQLAVSLKQPFLRGFKSMPICKQSGVAIVCPILASSPALRQCNFDYRVINHQTIKWTAYIQMLFEIYNINIPNFAKKISKVLEYLQQTLPQIVISRNDFYNWVLSIDVKNENQNSIARHLSKKINRKELKPCKRKLISKLFHMVFGITNLEQLASYKSIREFSQSEQQITKLTSILKENKICVVTGQTSQFKDSVVQAVCKQFSQDKNQIKSLIVTNGDIKILLGHYEHGKWVNGILSHKIVSNFDKKKCFILVGEFNQSIIDFLHNLDGKNEGSNFVNLQNGQKLELGPEQRIIFATESKTTDSLVQNCQLKIHDLSHVKFSPEEVFEYLATQKKIGLNELTFESKHFSKNQQVFNSLRNIYLNNSDKFSHSNLKTLGYKNEYMEPELIMKRFMAVLNSALSKDAQKICPNNQKMMDKAYLWSLYWAIGSNLPQRCIERLQKLFDAIKVQVDRSQTLSQSKFAISQRNQSVYKFIKSHKIFQNPIGDQFVITSKLEAKKQLIKLLSIQNNHVLLIGNKGTGKTSFMGYLQSEFKTDGYSLVKIKLTPRTTLHQLLQWIKSRTYIQFFPNDPYQKYRLCSANGKKLVIFIDNFNLIDIKSELFQFFQTTTSYGYYYDRTKNSKVSIGDIFIVCANNGSFEPINSSHSFCIRNFFPILVDQVDFPQIISAYDEGLQAIAHQQKAQILHRILSNVGSLHLFITNLFSCQKSSSENSPSYALPIWIIKQLIKRAQDEQYSPKQLISLWRYITIKKYIQNGMCSQFEQEIKRELDNMINMMAKNSAETEGFLKDEKQFIQEIYKNNPLLKLKYNYYDYYCFVAFLMGSEQLKHVITHSQTIHPSLKQKIINYICEKRGINCHHLTDLKQLKSLKESTKVFYVDCKDKNIIQFALTTIIEQSLNPQLTFILDFETKQQLEQSIKFYPSAWDLTHIYDAPQKIDSTPQEIQNFNTISRLLESFGFKIGDNIYEELFWAVDEAISRLRPNMTNLISKRKTLLQTVYNNFNSLSTSIQQGNKQCEDISKQIAALTAEEETAYNHKNQLMDTLSKLKKNGGQAHNNEKQAVNKSLNIVDTQLKRIKSNRNEKNEQLSKLKENFKEKLDTYTLLRDYQQTYFKNYEICNDMVNDVDKMNWFLAIHAITYLYYQNPVHPYFSNIFNNLQNFAQVKFTHTIPSIYSNILGVDISNLKQDQCVIRWILNGYQSQFVTKEPEKLFEKLFAKCPQVKIYPTHFEYTQYLSVKPIVSKDASNWGEAKVSIVCEKQPKDAEKAIKFECKRSNQVQKECLKLYGLIEAKDNKNLMLEKATLQTELQRFQTESSFLYIRLKDKIQSQKSQFLSVNFSAEIKQLFEAIGTLNNKIQIIKDKMSNFMKELQTKYGSIIQKYKQTRTCFEVLKKAYPYANFDEEQYLSIIVCSMVYKEVKSEKQEQNDGKELQKQLEVTLTSKKITQKLCHWVCLTLTPLHAVHAFFLLACNQLFQALSIEQGEYRQILSLFETDFQTSNEIKINSHKKLEEVLQIICNKRQNHIFTLIQFSQRVLKLNFRNLLASKESWISGISNLLETNILSFEPIVGRKIIFMLASQKFNSFKLVDKEIRQYLTNDQSIWYFYESDPIEQKIQMLEKTPGTQQGWVILNYWKKTENMNKFINFLEERSYRAVFLVQNTESMLKIKEQINANKFYQLTLHDKTKSICYQSLRIIAKHDIEKSSIQLNKLLKMMAFDQIFKMVKSFTEPQYKNISYSYRILQSLLRKNPKIKPSDLVSFALDFYYEIEDSKARLFLREARKICKGMKLPQVYDDGSLPEYYKHIAQSYDQIKSSMERQDKLKKLLDELLPKKYSNQISTDFLFSYDNYPQIGSPIPIKKQLTDKTIFKRSLVLSKLNEILQKAPILNKPEQCERIQFTHINMLANQKKILEKEHLQCMNRLRWLKKIAETNIYLSPKTEQQLIAIQISESDSVLEKLLQRDRTIQCITKQIESKQQLNIQLCLQLVRKSSQFLHAYLFQCRWPAKFDWTHLQIHMRCISQKEKETTKQHTEKNDNLHLANLKLNNGKFELHKCFLQSIQEGESSKLPTVLVHFNKQETHPLSRKVLFKVNQQKIGHIVMTSKAKQVGFWGCQVSVTFNDKQK